MEFIVLASAHFLALLSPGPDFFLIVQTAIRMKLRYSIAICAGIASANGVYLIFAILGIEVIRQNQHILIGLQYCGACYLVFIGYMLLKSKRITKDELNENKFFLHVQSIYKQFCIGFLSGILNPKNILFYFSLFTVLVSEETPFLTKCFYALWMFGVVFSWDVLIALCIGHKTVKNIFNKSIFYLEKVTGLALTFCGISLILF